MAAEAKGIVGSLWTSNSRTQITLLDLPKDQTPARGIFVLLKEHLNYNALYSLALVAATNRYALHVRINEESITDEEEPTIQWMAVEWT
jgi:hypothetical protein